MMADDGIFSRTSIRQFTDGPVGEEATERLLRAAMAAPSAGNQQPWEFVLTRDAAVRERLSQCSPYGRPAAGAALVIVPCIRAGEMRFPPCVPLDMSACVENILVEAAALGLGAVWLGVYPEQERMDAVAKVLGCSDGLQPFAMVAVGHPAEEVPPRSAKRYDPARVHWV